MTDLQSLILFLILVVGTIAAYGDVWTTAEGLSYGETEGNPVARWAMKKFGQAKSAFFGIAIYIFVSVLVSQFVSPLGGIIAAALVAGLEIRNVIRNYRMYTATPNYKNKVRVPVNFGK